MKIALITIHDANNYGAVLQAYATKKILSQYGEVSTINYNNPHLANHLDFIRFKLSIHGLKMFLHDLLRLKERYTTINKFKNFIKENMNLTLSVSKKEIEEGAMNEFDVYVCGSDQIWNPDIINAKGAIDTTYFLAFAPDGTKKISYASSMGAHIFTENEKIQLKKLLTDFEKISVREASSKDMLQDLLNRKVEHVLDPTLLLSKEEWIKTLNIDVNNRRLKEEYILVYSVPKSDLMITAVEYYKEKLGLKVAIIDQGLKPFVKCDYHIKDAGPKDFIELFANASFIITDSFHGTCFSVNFEKQFVSVSSGKLAGRMESLLKLLNIEQKIIQSPKDFTVAIVALSFDDKLKSIKKLSLNYLKEM
jgi:hypothetical protein